MKQNVFITGASGHIGNVIIKELSNNYKDEVSITCLLLENDNANYLKDFDLDIIRGNICDRELMFKLIKKNDIVIHLAGIISTSNKNKDLMYNVNYLGSKNIADACFKNKARLIYVSSVHVLNCENATIDENASLNVSSHRGEYEKTKALATSYIKDLFDNGLDGLIFYPSAIIGPFDYLLGETSRSIINIYNGKYPFYLNGGYSFVDVRDVSKMIVKGALSKNLSRQSYIISNGYISVKDLILYTSSLSKKPKKHLIYVPLFLVYIALPFISLFAKISKKKVIFSKNMVKTITSNGSFNISKIKKDLDYTPTDLHTTIKDTVEFLKEYQNLDKQ